MSLSTKKTQKRIRFSPESYTTTAVGSLKERLEQRKYYNNHTKPPALSSSSSVASSSPSPDLVRLLVAGELGSILASISNQKQPQHRHQATPIVTTIPSNLSYSDVCVGELLGSGAYASVYNVSFQTKNKRQKAHSSPCRLQFENGNELPVHQHQQQPPEVRDQDDDVSNMEDDTHRSLHLNQLNEHLHLKHNHLLLKHRNDDHNTQPYYALKCLQQDKLILQHSKNSKAAKIASTDFLMECKILSKIHGGGYNNNKGRGGGGGGHPNIIGLIGISNNFADDPSRGFLVLEKVSETLQQALVRWRGNDRGSENHSSSSRTHNHLSISPALHQRRHNKKRLLQREQGERVRLAGLGVARALQFLHEHRIIYRDIKPANIGFSQHDGQVRLLDFGLARHISRDNDPKKIPRKMLSGGCGTPRYAAPEVMLHLHYSFPADVHSFCILLWEIVTLQRPYSNCQTVQELLDMTIQRRRRPPLTGDVVVASSDLKKLLHSGWSHNPHARPSFHCIVKQLEFHVDAISLSKGSLRK